MSLSRARRFLGVAIAGIVAVLAVCIAVPALADDAGASLPGLEESWRYEAGQQRAHPATDGAVGSAKAQADGSGPALPLALNFRVSKQGDSYVADFGGGHMVVNGAKAFGIDVSEHNGTIDWQKAKAAGVDFAILRIGWGTYGERGAGGLSSTDAMFARNLAGARAAGVKVGVYLYSYAGWKPTQSLGYWEDYASREADHVLTVLERQGVEPGELDYPVYYDLEELYLEKPILSFGAEAVSNREFLAKIAKTFCDKIEGAGYEAGVYANLNWWNNFLTDPVFESWERWVARYPESGASGQSSLYQGAHAMWQAHSQAYVDGVGTCDINFDYRDDRGQAAPQESYFDQEHPQGSMFRLYNPSTGAHHFTTDAREAKALEASGWKNERIAWTCSSHGLPVYRLYNPSSGDHHFTMYPDERTGLIAQGWKDEGIAFHSEGKTAIYRLFNPNLTQGTHHYVASEAERDALVESGWTYESISFIAS